MTVFSGKISSAFSIPAAPGKIDKINPEDLGTNSPAVALALASDGPARKVTWTISGTEPERWAELSQLALEPSQRISVHLNNAGFVPVIENSGPATSAQLRVKAGPQAKAVVVGTIQIPAGESTFQYERPKTTLSVSGQVPGLQGWLLAPVTITLTAQDFSSTGIAAIETSHDKVTWTEYSAPFTYSDEGDTTLYYRAKDNAKNVELAKSDELKIDTRSPVISAVARADYTRVDPFVVDFSASDPAPGSGLSSVGGTLDGSAVANGESVDLLWFTLGPHTLDITAKDVAGWTTRRSVTFNLIATRESLQALVTELVQRGEIDSAGFGESLIHSAQHNLQALIREIDAQEGKHISVNAADLLRGDTEYVLAHGA